MFSKIKIVGDILFAMEGKTLRFALFLFCLPGMLAGCKKKDSFTEVKRDRLTIQIRKLPGSADMAGGVSYAARIIPDKGLAANDIALKTKMEYRADSTFYIRSGKQKIYADLVQPVANGVAGTFEYLVSFSGGDNEYKNGTLVYQDKYLNHQKYDFSLKNE